ncbi:MAG TPA: hypothetical protein DIW17_08675 [Clostridiales bacterium]|nr:hypothetical protein [Clostridia bacterium]HCS73935.1 hypothetical protein [Clostridiales bacterium]
MKNKILRFLTPVFAVWMDAWILFPILFSVYLGALQSVPFAVFSSLLVCAYILGAGIRRLLIRWNRLISLAVSLLIALGAGFLSNRLFPQSSMWAVIFTGLLVFAAAARGVFVSERPLIASFPKVYSYCSLAYYFFSYFFYGKLIAVQEYQHYLLIAGLIAIPSIFLLSNTEVLTQASQKELKDSTSMPAARKNNRVIIIITISAAVLIAGYQTLKDGFLTAVKAVARFIFTLIQRLLEARDSLSGGEGPPSGGAPELPPAEVKPPSPFWDAVVEIFGTVILIAMLLFAVYFIIKQLIKLWLFLVEKIKKLMESSRWGNGSEEEYDDEKENLLDWQSIRKNYTDSIRSWWERMRSTEPKWNQLTDNRQRVRFLYRHLIIQAVSSGFRFSSFRTANETIYELIEQGRLDQSTGSQLKSLYGKARYGLDPILDTQVAALGNSILHQKESGSESE